MPIGNNLSVFTGSLFAAAETKTKRVEKEEILGINFVRKTLRIPVDVSGLYLYGDSAIQNRMGFKKIDNNSALFYAKNSEGNVIASYKIDKKM